MVSGAFAFPVRPRCFQGGEAPGAAESAVERAVSLPA